MKLSVLIVSLSTLSPVIAMCDDTPAPPPQNVWIGKGQLGFVGSQGNTDSKSANAAIDLSYYDAPWKHALHLGGLYGQSAGITAAERWDALGQSSYDLTRDLYTFGALRYAHDLFSGFEYQASVAAGLGYKIIDTDATHLSAQVGVGYRKSAPEELIKAADGAVIERIALNKTNNAIVTAGLDYSQALTTTTTLGNKFLMEYGSSDTLLTDMLTLTVKMSTRLALSLGYGLQDNTKPPAGLKKLDTVETINLVFAF